MATRSSLLRISFPWLFAALVCALCIYVRVTLIQPPEVAHTCDASAPNLWAQIRDAIWVCKLRAAFIASYAWFGLGYAAMGLSVLTLVYRKPLIATLAMAVGAAGLVLYCFEPAAVSLALGAVVLAGLQARSNAVMLN